MSSGMKLDRADTVYEERARLLLLKNRSWLRHGKNTSAGKMDEMLFDGATIEHLSKGAKTTKGAVYVHLSHLRKVHKLVIVRKDGMFRYDLEGMKGEEKVKRKSRKGKE